MLNSMLTKLPKYQPYSRRSMKFDGVDDYCGTPDDAFNSYEQGSVSIWFQMINTPAVSTSYTLFSAGQSDGSGYLAFYLYNNGGNVELRIQNSTGGLGQGSTTTFSAGRWYHLVVTCNGSDWDAYVDGVEETVSANPGTWFADVGGTSTHYTIGALRRTSLALEANAYIADVEVYSQEISAADVLAIYNFGRPRDNSAISNRVAAWRMGDYDAYTTIQDTVGSNDLTATNMTNASIVNEVPGNWVNEESTYFDGVNDNCLGGDVLDKEYNVAFSVALWFKYESGAVSDVVFSKRLNSGSYRGWEVAFIGNKLAFEMTNTFDTNMVRKKTDTVLNDGEWHHFVATKTTGSTAASITLYVDGVVDTTTTDYDTLSATTASSANISIGSRIGAAGFYVGHLDEVAVFDDTLTAAEVKQLWNNGRGSDPRLLADFEEGWRLGDGDDTTTVYALSGTSANDLTRTNMTDDAKKHHVPLDPRDRQWYWRSFDFDGVNEYLVGGDVHDIDYNEAKSIEFWIKTAISGSTYLFVSKYTHSSPFDGWYIASNSQNKLRLNINKGSGGTNTLDVETTANVLSTLYDDNWHHVIVTKSTGTDVKMYIDTVDTATSVNTSTLSSDSTTTKNFGIAAAGNGQFYTDCRIARVAIYDKELSATEVLELYRGGIPYDIMRSSVAGNVEGLWTPDNIIPTDVLDASVNNNTMTMTNMEGNIDLPYDVPVR